MPWSISSASRTMVDTVAIGPDDRMEMRRADIAAAVKPVDTGEGVIILTDMFGGTPSNLAISLLEEGKVEVVAGLNLPMLVKLARIRKDYDLDKAPPPPRTRAANTSTSPARFWGTDCRRWSGNWRSSTSAACMPAPRPNSSNAPKASMPTSR